MAPVGNYVSRNRDNPNGMRTSKWTKYNKGWAAKRQNSIQQGQALRSNLSSVIYQTNASVSLTKQLTYGSSGTYTSNIAAMSRINIQI